MTAAERSNGGQIALFPQFELSGKCHSECSLESFISLERSYSIQADKASCGPFEPQQYEHQYLEKIKTREGD